MSESNVTSVSGQTTGSTARFPRKMLILTGFVALMSASAFGFVSELDDRFGIGADVVMVYSVFGLALLLLLWVAWFLLSSGLRWWQRVLASLLLLAVPVLAMKLLRPVNSGDATIVRFEPVWSAPAEVTVEDVTIDENPVDLKTETPDDFPRFLGSAQNGAVSSGLQIDADRFAETKILWKQPIGRGWSGFVARNGFAVTMEQREDQECVTCYDMGTGALQWIYQHRARHRDAVNLGRTGPRVTPTISDGMVYAVGAVGNLVCLNGADGTVRWQCDLNELLDLQLQSSIDSDGFEVSWEGNSSLAWGRSGCPLIVGDLVVVPGGGPRDGRRSTLLAFDRLSGELIWRGGDEMIAYGSPILATVAGTEQILMTAESKVMGFDPETGEVLWHFPRPGQSDSSANTSQVTVVDHDHVLTSKGYPDGGGELIRLDRDGKEIRPASVWKNALAFKTKLTSPVVFEGHAYSLSNGFLECARLADGERIWKRRGRFGHGQLLLVGNHLLVHGESGTLSLVEATTEGYREIGIVDTVDGVCWNTICLAGNRLLVRSELEAACLELPVRP
ncbi:MAG: PQQ-like beta-propeller repeat protein [Fuerstiella sp.]